MKSRSPVLVLAAVLFACSAPDRTGGLPGEDAGTTDPDALAFLDAPPTTDPCDGLDNDGNGLVDDGCSCTLGDTQPCYPGAPATRAVGQCRDGEQVCEGDDDGEFGGWQDCLGAIVPGVEVCDAGLVDEDCDGVANEDCGCLPGSAPVPCGSDEGACVAGTRTCGADGVLGDCAGDTGPAAETCNGADDNCDGTTDEGCTCEDGQTMPCGSDVGACVAGVQTCVGGTWGTCGGGTLPATEICNNGIDEDCDGPGDDVCSPPVVTCSGAIATVPLATVTLSGTGSDPDGGTVTYQWTVTARPSGSSSVPSSPRSASTNFFVDLAGGYDVTLTVTDDEGLTASCVIAITAVPSGDLHVELTWDEAYGDADLHLVRADVAPATAWFTGNDCFWNNASPNWPPMGRDGNATLDRDDTNGLGPENINITDNPASGVYAIGVGLYCSHSLARNPGTPVTPGDGPLSAQVRVYCGGALAATYDGISLERSGRFVDLARITWPGCAGMSIDNRTWTALVQPAAYPAPLHCALPCTGNGDCGGGEVCGAAGTCVLD